MRRDGKVVKDISAFSKLVPYIMTKTYDAQNHVKQYIEFDPLRNYIREKANTKNKISYLALIISAYVKAVNKYPEINRFVVNKKIYQRNYLSVSFVMMKRNHLGKHDQTVVKVKFNPTDTLNEVNDKINNTISENTNPYNENKADYILRILTKLPFFLSPIVSLIKLLDKLGLLPMSFIDASPFHTSMFVTNLISIRTNYIYHHLYEFGTTCLFISMGNLEKKPQIINEELTNITYMPLGIVMDERICSGYEYSRFFKLVNRYLKKPELLE